jgi:UDP-N-acetylglucosamine 1-carboxyvinyltransferase
MDKFIINGPVRLNGEVDISGSKNAALPIMCACLAFPGVYTISNIPELRDTKTMLRLLKIIGCNITHKEKSIIIDTRKCNNPEAPYDLVKTMRASFYVLGPLLSRFKYAKVSLPGGCAWGPRPINFHLEAFKKLGSKVTLDSGYILTEGHLKSAKIKFPIPSVGATGNVIMACVNLTEEVIIENASMEPEIVDLCNFYLKCGVSINGIGTNKLTIRGIDIKEDINIKYSIIPDRIEAGTFLIAATATKGSIKINNCTYKHLGVVIDKLKDVGASISYDNTSVSLNMDKDIKPVSLKTDVYPGFPTDLQAQWIALMSISNGASKVEDTIYLDRFTHVPELIRLGAKIDMSKNIAKVTGVENLFAAKVMSTDIRASASLLSAALCSNGKTHLSRIYHIDRGYEKIENKLSLLGANIKRIKE